MAAVEAPSESAGLLSSVCDTWSIRDSRLLSRGFESVRGRQGGARADPNRGSRLWSRDSETRRHVGAQADADGTAQQPAGKRRRSFFNTHRISLHQANVFLIAFLGFIQVDPYRHN